MENNPKLAIFFIVFTLAVLNGRAISFWYPPCLIPHMSDVSFIRTAGVTVEFLNKPF